MKRILLILVIVGVTVGIDQVTKVWAVKTLKQEMPTSYFGDTFKLVYAENEGAFLGRGANLSPTLRFWILKIMPLIVLLGIFGYLLFSSQMPLGATIAFALVVGGGFSNIADRFLNNGSVVDFMNMGIGSLRTGIFNFADVFIMIGIGMLLFSQMFGDKKVKTIEEEFGQVKT